MKTSEDIDNLDNLDNLDNIDNIDNLEDIKPPPSSTQNTQSQSNHSHLNHSHLNHSHLNHSHANHGSSNYNQTNGHDLQNGWENLNLSELFPLTNPHFIRYLNIIGISLVTISILYLVASNWFMIPKALRIIIPMLFMMLTAGMSTLDRWSDSIRQTLQTVCGVLIGLTLASIGQVYQTGADAYQLFLLWAVLLIPWLLYDLVALQSNAHGISNLSDSNHNITNNTNLNHINTHHRNNNDGVFVLWSVVSHLALFMYFKQTFLLESFAWLDIILVNMLTLLQFFLSIKYYPRSRFILLVWIGIISITSSFALIFSSSSTPLISELIYVLSLFFMSAVAIAHFYRKNKQLETVLAITGLSLAIMCYLIYLIIDNNHSAIGILLTSAIVVFAEFALLAYLFTQLFKNHHNTTDHNTTHNATTADVVTHVSADSTTKIANIAKENISTQNDLPLQPNQSKTEAQAKRQTENKSKYHIVLLAIGAWIAGLLFSGFMLVAWDWFSVIAGVGFLIGGVTLINQNHDVSRHLGYCLAIAGQSAIMIHVADELNNVYALLPIQAIIFIGVMYFLHKPHWLYVTLQLLASFAVISAIQSKAFDTISLAYMPATTVLLFTFFALLLVIHRQAVQPYVRSIVITVLALLAYSLSREQILLFNLFNADILTTDRHLLVYQAVGYLCTFAWFVGFIYLYQRHQKPQVLIAITLLAVAVAYFGYFELLIVLMIIAWALAERSILNTHKPIDKLMLSLAVVVFGWGLWQLYYHLHISFLYKSLTIFISGLLVFALARVLTKTTHLAD